MKNAKAQGKKRILKRITVFAIQASQNKSEIPISDFKTSEGP